MLKEKILDPILFKETMLNSRKSNENKVKLSVLRFLKSEISKNEAGIKTLSDGNIVNIIKASIENVKLLKDGDWETEVSILESFLPKQMSEPEINNLLNRFFEENEVKSIGQVMGHFKKNFDGKLDFGVLSKLTKEKIQ